MDEKIAVLQSWVNAINNKGIYKKTESECEQAFNNDIFHKVLGYSFYPTENYTLEAKGWNEVSGQKADATLGYFNTSDIEKNVSLVQVAVEIKDANTALTKSQRREWNLSPIQQWFKYKPQYNNCKRVLVTNFIEVRLFKDTQLDYEVWNLVDLINPENEYHNFKVFWYLLNAKHLIAPVGTESVTERLLSVVRIQTEQITKKFYQEYKTLRLELINDIRSNNPAVSLDVVIQKSQKVIDRIVFVHFCEDFGLLPDGKLAEVIQYSQSLVGVSVWQILSGFFEAVNSGSSKLGIPNGYNGGLFHEDKELNNLKIGDAICQKFVDLWKYDFQEELSVNILWHIFEQSISDLEDLRINMLGIELETWELGESSKSNKRKKDGIFYTPEYIVDYIVRNSLGKYLEDQFEIIERKHLKKEKQMSDKVYQEKQQSIYGEYKQVLENITVLDPACGSGAFLVKVFDYLLAEHKRVGEVLNSIFDNESTYKSILQRNIYGVDLNAESVEITKLSLWLKTAEKGKKLADLDGNIKCGNSLIDNPVVSGDKAFDWKTEFADIMNAWGFDVVVGNPPYVTTKYENMNWNIKQYFLDKYAVAYDKLDLYVLFMEQSIRLLKNDWKVSMITPWNFMKNFYSFKLRKFILDYTTINFFTKPLETVFLDAVVETIVRCFTKWSNQNYDINFNEISINWLQELGKISNTVYENNKDNIFDLSWSDIANQVLVKCKIWSQILWKVALNYIWIMAWWQKDMVSDSPIFEKSKKVLSWREIWRYNLQYEWNYINFDRSKIHSNDREEVYLSDEKVLLRKTGNSFVASYDNSQYFTLQSLYNIIIYDNTKHNSKYLLALLNSKLFTYLYQIFFITNPQQFPYIKRKHLDEFPIKNISLPEQQPFIEKADQMLTINKSLHEKIDFTLRFLQSKFAIDKPSTKLQKFRELDFAGFLKTLNIKKIPMDTEAELMRYFEKEKADILTLKSQIDTVDKQIDEMVFDLYWLTEEERKVVLDS